MSRGLALLLIVMMAGCVSPPEPIADTPVEETVGPTVRTEDVALRVHVYGEEQCTAGTCTGNGGNWPGNRVRPNETIDHAQFRFDVEEIPAWVTSYTWRVLCELRNCVLGEAVGMPPFELEVAGLQGVGLEHEYFASGGEGFVVLNLLDNEADITGKLSISGFPSAPLPLQHIPFEFSGRGPLCVPGLDPSCGVIGTSSLHVLPEKGRPYHVELNMTWDDPLVEELTLTLSCTTPGAGQCPEHERTATGSSPLQVSWELWQLPQDERLFLQVRQLETDAVNLGTRPAYEINGTLSAL